VWRALTQGMCGTDVDVNDVGQRFYLVPLYLY
jgi:hypothetical protein